MSVSPSQMAGRSPHRGQRAGISARLARERPRNPWLLTSPSLPSAQGEAHARHGAGMLQPKGTLPDWRSRKPSHQLPRRNQISVPETERDELRGLARRETNSGGRQVSERTEQMWSERGHRAPQENVTPHVHPKSQSPRRRIWANNARRGAQTGAAPIQAAEEQAGGGLPGGRAREAAWGC